MKDEWVEDAACLRASKDEAFPPERRAHKRTGTILEKPRKWNIRVEAHAEDYRERYCAACPVRTECFADSMKARATSGVWGGVSEAQRQRWLKSGRRWRCEQCGIPIDPDLLRTDPDRTRCGLHEGTTP